MADSDLSPVAKACTSCAKSKSKCDWTTGTRCHRCTRLNKECTPQESIRKRKPPRIRRAIQIAQLEEKVNCLLSAVGNATVQQPSIQSSSDPRSNTPSSSVSTVDNGPAVPPNARQPSCRPVVAGMPIRLPSISNVHLSLDEFETLVVKDPAELLSIFQNQFASQVPFVVMPPSMTAESLRREKPFVYMAVLMATSYDNTGIQLMLGKKFLEYLVEQLILRGEKTLDILQGLLIYLCWYHHFLVANHQLNNLLALVSALFVDLGLKRVSAENEVNEAFIQITQRTQGHSLQPKQLTIEEKRAMLGCYYLSSCLTSSFSRMDCMRFTPYIEECCEILQQGSDANLACLLKLQSLVEKQRLSGLWEVLDTQHSVHGRSPVTMLVRACETDLQNFKNTLSNEQLFNPFFAMNYYSAEIHLYEACFKIYPTTGPDYSMESFHPADVIYKCFVATRSFFDMLLSIPASEYCKFSIVNVGQMFHALGALYKLSVFEVAEWDVGKVRTTLNLSSVLNEIAICGEHAGNSYGPTEADSAWFYCSRKLRTLQTWWDAKLAQEADLGSVLGIAQDGTFDDFQAMINIDFLDGNFWK